VRHGSASGRSVARSPSLAVPLVNELLFIRAHIARTATSRILVTTPKGAVFAALPMHCGSAVGAFILHRIEFVLCIEAPQHKSLVIVNLLDFIRCVHGGFTLGHLKIFCFGNLRFGVDAKSALRAKTESMVLCRRNLYERIAFAGDDGFSSVLAAVSGIGLVEGMVNEKNPREAHLEKLGEDRILLAA